MSNDNCLPGEAGGPGIILARREPERSAFGYPRAMTARTQRTQGRRESMLLSRQPRACKASALCIRLWII